MIDAPTWLPAALAAFGVLLVLGALAGLRALAREERATERLDAAVALAGGRRRTMQGRTVAPLPARLERPIGLLAAFWGIDPRRRATDPLPWWAVLALALPAAFLPLALSATLFGGVVLWLTPLLWWLIARRTFAAFAERTRNRLYEQLPDALGAVSRALHVGLSIVDAMRSVARTLPEPTASEFRQIVDRLVLGMTLAEAIDEAAKRNGLAEYRFLAAVVGLQAQVGGGIAATLDSVADLIRRRLAIRRRGLALTSEARAAAWILGALPFVTFAGIAVTTPDYARLLLTDPIGHQVLAVAMILLLLGIFSMRQLIRRSLA